MERGPKRHRGSRRREEIRKRKNPSYKQQGPRQVFRPPAVIPFGCGIKLALERRNTSEQDEHKSIFIVITCKRRCGNNPRSALFIHSNTFFDQSNYSSRGNVASFFYKNGADGVGFDWISSVYLTVTFENECSCAARSFQYWPIISICSRKLAIRWQHALQHNCS